MNLLWRIERYLNATATPPARFGRDAAHDPRFVFDLRNGRTPRPETEARIAAWLDAREAGR
ncbi:hypothetical protein GCM10023232_13490 [Sphingosinicella ginsenosidimutans]|jgi:hypothetical protein|uniref:Uncharacterized protein n=1 Tax=Allosphingosinicella ginsenosidimutans TaxID=1176539 RepID=A0A5C6TPH5_9SPHN|nr:hypothetical protein [Sphingosinicella ginsenosidimutans]TXC62442.1 hypothetical protein FRZ32_01485 [Sphingosinicella ginsenosidimutans]